MHKCAHIQQDWPLALFDVRFPLTGSKGTSQISSSMRKMLLKAKEGRMCVWPVALTSDPLNIFEMNSNTDCVILILILFSCSINSEVHQCARGRIGSNPHGRTQVDWKAFSDIWDGFSCDR